MGELTEGFGFVGLVWVFGLGWVWVATSQAESLARDERMRLLRFITG
jgi:hypothetical protein